MRIVLDLVIGINAIAGIIGFALRKNFRAKRQNHLDYIAQLREENEQLDQEIKRLG